MAERPRLVPGTLAHQYEVEAHLVEELDDLVATHSDCTLPELLQVFARCAGAILGGILCQYDAQGGAPVDVPALLDEVHRHLRETREVGLADWTGEGR
jgi:hypothetical protein